MFNLPIIAVSLYKKMGQYVVLVLVLGTYIFGSAGFTIHHCCSKKHYHTTSAILNAFHPYIIEDCKKYQEHISADKAIKIRQNRHCGNWVYSMSSMKYNNEDNQESSYLFSMAFFKLILPENSFQDISLQKDHPFCDVSHIKKRRWREPDVLRIYRI